MAQLSHFKNIFLMYVFHFSSTTEHFPANHVKFKPIYRSVVFQFPHDDYENIWSIYCLQFLLEFTINNNLMGGIEQR